MLRTTYIANTSPEAQVQLTSLRIVFFLRVCLSSGFEKSPLRKLLSDKTQVGVPRDPCCAMIWYSDSEVLHG